MTPLSTPVPVSSFAFWFPWFPSSANIMDPKHIGSESMHVAVMIIAGVMSGDERALRHFYLGALTGLLEKVVSANAFPTGRMFQSKYGGLSRPPWPPQTPF